LVPGKAGLGFAVGKEPLVSAFASHGASIVATDMAEEAAATAGWTESGQHSHSIDGLRNELLCPRSDFDRLARFETCNMNAIPEAYHGAFDFVWSSCALEHVGTMDLAKAFIQNSLKCLKRGGVAVHTTEFNVSSNEDTLLDGVTVLFRKRDIEEVAQAAIQAGAYTGEIAWEYGDLPEDFHVDVPPYKHDPHLKLMITSYVVTTVGMTFVKL